MVEEWILVVHESQIITFVIKFRRQLIINAEKYGSRYVAKGDKSVVCLSSWTCEMMVNRKTLVSEEITHQQ